jgi:molybdate transport system regulatory protein
MQGLHIEITFGKVERIGPGKVRLLELIAEKGSITEAAQAMGMSYRKAWLLVDAIDKLFPEPLIEKRVGGHGKGGASLTPLGHEVIRQYRAFEDRCQSALEADYPLLAEVQPGPRG